MTLASEQPHLLGVDEDRFSAGVVLYYIKVTCNILMRYYSNITEW